MDEVKAVPMTLIETSPPLVRTIEVCVEIVPDDDDVECRVQHFRIEFRTPEVGEN